MSKLFLVLILLVGSSVSQASSYREMNEDAAIILTAAVNCPAQLEALKLQNVNFEKVTLASPRPIDPKVLITFYIVSTSTGGYAPIFEKKNGPTLTIQQTITQPPVSIPDKPANVTWKCDLIPPNAL